MYKYNPNSEKFTDLLLSHTFNNVFELRECSGSASIVRLSLNNAELDIYVEDELQQTIKIDKSFTIKSEDIGTYELRISFKQNEEFIEWKLYANSLSIFTEWKQALLISRRPRLIHSSVCTICQANFHIFRRRLFCKYCGQSLCSECCQYRAQLADLAYTGKQELCKRCVLEIRIPGYGVQNSMMLKRKKFESKSIIDYS